MRPGREADAAIDAERAMGPRYDRTGVRACDSPFEREVLFKHTRHSADLKVHDRDQRACKCDAPVAAHRVFRPGPEIAQCCKCSVRIGGGRRGRGVAGGVNDRAPAHVGSSVIASAWRRFDRMRCTDRCRDLARQPRAATHRDRDRDQADRRQEVARGRVAIGECRCDRDFKIVRISCVRIDLLNKLFGNLTALLINLCDRLRESGDVQREGPVSGFGTHSFANQFARTLITRIDDLSDSYCGC